MWVLNRYTTKNPGKEVTKLDVQLLVRISKLSKGSLLERRRGISKDFVLAGLSNYNINDQFNPRELKDKIKYIANVDIDEEVIVSNLEDLSKDEFVNHISKMTYVLNKTVDIPKFEDMTKPVWNEFISFLIDKYNEFDTFIDSEIETIFNSILMKISVQIVLSQKTLIESLPFQNFRSIIEKEIQNSGIAWRNKFVNIFFEYLSARPPKLLEFIFARYSGIINMSLIMMEREIPKFDLIDNVGFLLVDTSFLVSLMCETDNTHALAAAVCNQCKKRNIPLYYIEKTKLEMNSLILGSKHEMQGLRTNGNPRIIQSQFVNNYNKRRNIKWVDYYAELATWEKTCELFWNVTMMKEKYEPEENVYDYVKNYLPILDRLRYEERIETTRYSKPLRDEQQIEHDAICLGIVATARQKPRRALIGPWFLTFDNLVFGVSEFYSHTAKQDFMLSIQPRTWLNYLLTFSKIEFKQEEIDSVAEAIILFTTNDRHPKIELEEYTRLITDKLGLEEDDSELLMEILLKSPLIAELENALEAGKGGDADRTVYKILTDDLFVDKIIEQRHLKRNIKQISGKLRELQKQLGEEKAAREALERCARYNIYIKTDVKTTIDLSIETQLNSLAAQLETLLPGGFEKYDLPPPPKGEASPSKIRDWLMKLKEGLTTTKDITDDAKSAIENAKALLSYITFLIGQLQGLQ